MSGTYTQYTTHEALESGEYGQKLLYLARMNDTEAEAIRQIRWKQFLFALAELRSKRIRITRENSLLWEGVVSRIKTGNKTAYFIVVTEEIEKRCTEIEFPVGTVLEVERCHAGS